jgi:hypothetical protein
MRIQSGWLAVAVLMGAAHPAVAEPKLAAQHEKNGTEFLSPAGWPIDLGEDGSKAVANEPSGKGALSISALRKKSMSVDAWIKILAPGAAPKAADGWTCGEAPPDENGHVSGACGREDGEMLLLVELAAEKSFYKQLGGLKLARKVAVSAKGFKVAPPTTE